MRLKFKTVYRGAGVLVLLTLFFSIWASAQTTNITDTNATVVIAVHEKGTNDVMSFGLREVTWLQHDLFKMGHPTWQYLASIIFIVIAYYVAKGVDWITNNRIKAWVAKNPTNLDNLLLDLLHGPVKVITFVVVLHAGLKGMAWPDWVSAYASKFLTFVVGLSLTYVAVKCVDVLIEYWKERALVEEAASFDEMLFPAIRKCLKGFVIIVGVLVTSQNLGVDISSALASLSI